MAGIPMTLFGNSGCLAVLPLQAFTVISICLKQLRNVLTNTREGWRKVIEGQIAVARLQ
ncbi:hypothetical protein J6590_097327, partial [Homalodisca vitripennis]